MCVIPFHYIILIPLLLVHEHCVHHRAALRMQKWAALGWIQSHYARRVATRALPFACRYSARTTVGVTTAIGNTMKTAVGVAMSAQNTMSGSVMWQCRWEDKHLRGVAYYIYICIHVYVITVLAINICVHILVSNKCAGEVLQPNLRLLALDLRSYEEVQNGMELSLIGMKRYISGYSGIKVLEVQRLHSTMYPSAFSLMLWNHMR